jgi:hypothetical protein
MNVTAELAAAVTVNGEVTLATPPEVGGDGAQIVITPGFVAVPAVHAPLVPLLVPTAMVTRCEPTTPVELRP